MGVLKKVLIMAGGTGGHVFPGLAVAQALKEKNIEVHWLGTQQGIEARLVPEAGIPIHFIHIKGLRGKGIKDILLLPWRLTAAIFQSIKWIHQFKPDVVLGMGGFVSGPGGIASIILGKKLVIHEQNAKPGMTNRFLAKVADQVMEGFPHTFKQSNIVTTGNPVRPAIAQLSPPAERFKNRASAARLLIVGGSLGAQAFNQLLPPVLAKIPSSIRPQVWHQTGEKFLAETIASYRHHGVQALVEPFITSMEKAYAWADMVLCRAGALTIAELCAAGLGAILVPFPFAVDDHQTDNAQFMVENNAAILVQQKVLTENKLVELLINLLNDAEKRQAMALAAYQLRRVDAAERVIQVCETVYNGL